MKNPYEELEVENDFTEEKLKSQFRKLAKKCHPDLVKGSTDKFVSLKKAFNILRDPKKRKYYDETGTFFDDMEENKITSNAKENLFKLVEQIIHNPAVMQHYKNMNLIDMINKALNDNRNNIILNIKRLTKECETTRNILERLKYKGTKDDFMKGMIENSIKEREGMLKNMSNSLKIFDIMLEMVKDYDYNFEEAVTFYSTNGFSNLNSTTTSAFG